jgi:dihydroflavonol-4-reductase
VRAVVSGGAGFIGRSLVRQVRARGDTVVAIVRDAARARTLRELGCELVEGDLASMPADALRTALGRANALFHLAGSYRIGIPATAHAVMHQANVGATRAVLDAAIAAGVPRIVYVSTANVYGDTHGRVVEETYRRPQPPEFLSITTRRSTSPTSRPKSG